MRLAFGIFVLLIPLNLPSCSHYQNNMSEEKSLNFIEEIIENDLNEGRYQSIVTRFPPEPNGYLHMGHASSICLNFGLTQKFKGYTNLRFDDTNPSTEETEYVDSIKEDIKWLGFSWENEHYASDYFDQLFEYAVTLINKGLAYVDDNSSDTIALEKGTPTQPGKNSIYRDRSIAENLTLFTEMKSGKYADGIVSGWDDPRMPTISGMRRRGFTPESIRDFCDRIGIAKRENLVDIGLLEFCVREHLNKTSIRRMVVLDPLKVTITNFPDAVEMIESEDNPEVENYTYRSIPFSKELYIEREDFMEDAPKKFFRLAPGKMVRLKAAYIIQCDEVVKDETGNVIELKCTYFPDSRSGNDTSGINVKGTLHWVSVEQANKIEIRMYDRLFTEEHLDGAEGDFKDYINPKSLEVIKTAYAEPALALAELNQRFQFLRKGYFCLDKDSSNDTLIFNRTVTLKDNWQKDMKK